MDDQPGLRSVIISICLPPKRWGMVVAAFFGSFVIVAPLAGPKNFLLLTVHNPVVAGGFEWALVMPIRPLFIAILLLIYKDFRP
ncbi:MAG TPA: hypothetical protein VKT25_07345, partial [Ktedonobacteraceae bacterium]|nr:hypothetical protein [Ktedonobacteraceae bacterium]